MREKNSPTISGETIGVIQQISEGKLRIESVDEAEQLLHIYPDDPALQRVYADLLLEDNRLTEAYEVYGKAAEGFIAAGMNLQAIVAKILQWSLQKPDHSQGRAFHTILHEAGADLNPLQRFFARLSYPELVTVMRRLVRVRLVSGQDVKKAGDPAKEVFFVVSGTLEETYPADRDSVSVLIAANDIFGDIFPLDKQTASSATIKALTDVELVKISKPVLHSACQKYPNIEKLLRKLYKAEKTPSRPWQTVRRNPRYGLPTKVTLTFDDPNDLDGSAKITNNHSSSTIQRSFNPPQSQKERYEGIALDLSVGGTCVELTPQQQIPQGHPGYGQSATISIDLLNDTICLDLKGTVVWTRHGSNQHESVLLGLKFHDLETADLELLEEYCRGCIGEQNLLWSLWQSIIQPQQEERQIQ